tara:strand:+ start:950 stop:1252 length:303 start_codon:yes stop_codon:yes gene_type:complete
MSRDAQAAEKVATGLSECVHTVANEPSLGLYYVMEHIQRSVPAVVGIKRDLASQRERLEGADLDAAFAQEQLHAAVSDDTKQILTRAAKLAAEAAQKAAS